MGQLLLINIIKIEKKNANMVISTDLVGSNYVGQMLMITLLLFSAPQMMSDFLLCSPSTLRFFVVVCSCHFSKRVTCCDVTNFLSIPGQEFETSCRRLMKFFFVFIFVLPSLSDFFYQFFFLHFQKQRRAKTKIIKNKKKIK